MLKSSLRPYYYFFLNWFKAESFLYVLVIFTAIRLCKSTYIVSEGDYILSLHCFF